MMRKINTEFVIVVMGSEYMDPEDFAGALYGEYGINSLVVTNLPFAKQMVKGIDNIVDNVIFIHLTMPVDKLAKRIAEMEQLPYEDAYALADDACFTEEIVDFDNTTPDDLRIITYTGESEMDLDKFLDACADIIEENGKKEEVVEDNGIKRS